MPPDAASLKPVLARIADGATLGEAEAQAAFALVMDGAATPAQIAALAMGLAVRGETVDELVGAARAMRARMVRVEPVAGAIDVCGTGGDGHATLNVSTAVALVLAATGVRVAKHGNRAISSRAGAADTLEALGLPPVADPALQHRALSECGIAFLAAPLHHPAMRHAGPVRAELGVRTIFNLLGPLCNPAGIVRQMLGVFAPGWQEPMARALHRLGSECAWVVHGETDVGPGMDELGLAGINHVISLDRGRISRFAFAPEEVGLTRRPVAAVAGGSATENASALERLLSGETGAYRDMVLLNAAAAIHVSVSPSGVLQPGDCGCMSQADAPIGSLRDKMAVASQALDGGSALAVLHRLRATMERG